MIGKIKSFLFDKRFPHFLPYILAKKHFLKFKIKEPEKILLSLTFDVEYNPLIEDNHVENFLEKSKSFLEKSNSTIFVCSEVVEKTEKLKNFKNCEIGLHGYKHELWGDEKWWLAKSQLNKDEKRKLLELSIKIFKKKGLKRPVSFRAPYMISNLETLKILEEFNFLVDSSASTYLNEDPLPYRIGKITRIPVSVNPIPEIRKIFLLPFGFYKIFNMQNFYNFDEEKFFEYVKILTSFQLANKIKPHLVFLAHSYEFFKIEKLSYCSPKNYRTLIKMVKILKDEYEIETLTIKNLAKKVFV